jgi:site-specific recombinase XerD
MSTHRAEIHIPATPDGGGDRVPDLTPREARDRWLGKLRRSKSDDTVETYEYQLKHFVEWCEEEGIDSMGKVGGWDLDTFETQRRDHLKLITLNAEQNTLQRFLEYCARIDLVDESLPKKIDPPKVPADQRVNKIRLHTDDAKALLRYYEEHDYGSQAHCLLALAWYTGARIGGIRALDVGDYDSENQRVAFFHRPQGGKDGDGTPLKNGVNGERAVGLRREICDVVDEYVDTHRHDKYDKNGRRPLITSESGRPTPGTLGAWMNLATQPCLHSPCPHGKERATCEYTEYQRAAGCPSSRSPHRVRRGSITWQLNCGVPIEKVAKNVNASVRVIEEHYDVPTIYEDLEERRRGYVDLLRFDESEEDPA